MKNLKKVLALVLAFACAFTMFAGAAFSDQSDIQTEEAVDALVGLGVINGYTDGTFKPDATVTRAEMAKMIFTILNGGNDDASAYRNLPTSFTDMPDNWYQGYIKYLQNSGIIAGKNATHFAPNDTVTGVEAAKMLLVVAGYDATKAGLVGRGWMANTMKYANLNNLFEDVDTDINGPLPRQYAAQLLYNSLEMERVVYSNDINDFKPATDVTDEATIGAKYLDLIFAGRKSDVEVYLDTTEIEAGRDTYSLEVSGDLNKTFTRIDQDYSDLVGQRVVVMYKSDNKQDKVYGVYAYGDSKVVAEGYVGELDRDGDKIKLAGTAYKMDPVFGSFGSVYSFNHDTQANPTALVAMAKKDNDAVVNEVAQPIKLIDTDGDGKVDNIVTSPVKVGKVTYVGASSLTVDNGIGSLKFDDITGYEGVKKDDYIFVTEEEYNSSDKDIVTKADITSATVEATKSDSGNTKVIEARVDGTWYRTAAGVTVKSGSAYDMVICGKYILFADETKGSLDDVAFLDAIEMNGSAAKVDTGIGSNKTEGTVKARIYFADGTNAEVKLSKYDGDKLNQSVADTNLVTGGASKSGLIAYSKLSDDTYDVVFVDNTNNKAGSDDVLLGQSGIADDKKIDGNPVNEDAVIYVVANTEIKVVSGKTVRAWDNVSFTNGTLMTKERDGLNYVAVACLKVSTAKVPGATSDTQYGYLTRDGYKTTVNGETKAAYEVWTSEGQKTIIEDSSTPLNTAKTGKVISYTLDGDYVKDVALAGEDSAIIGTDRTVKGSAKVAGATHTGTYSFDEDCVFAAINDEDNEGAEGDISGISLAQPCGSGNYIANAILVFNSDSPNKIVAVFYDVDKLDRNTNNHDNYGDHVHYAG